MKVRGFGAIAGNAVGSEDQIKEMIMGNWRSWILAAGRWR